MTPEEHIERAELLLATTEEMEEVLGLHELRIHKASVHVSIATHKKKYPPEGGRPLRSNESSNSKIPVRESGRMHNHVKGRFCLPASCPAHGTDSSNYPRPISDNPQA